MIPNNIDMKKLMEIMKMLKDSKLTPEQLFYKKAKEIGVDPNEILKLLK